MEKYLLYSRVPRRNQWSRSPVASFGILLNNKGMDASFSYSGSPLIPWELVGVYAIAILSLFLFFIYFKKLHIAVLMIGIHVMVGVVFGFYGIYVLYPTPQVLKTAFHPNTLGKGPGFEITFDRPVKRYNLIKTVTPYTAGIWRFEDPMYATHLYRKLVFYPYSYFQPGKKYIVSISQIQNFLSNNSYATSISFDTRDTFDVLGMDSALQSESKVSIISSFPQDGWDGVSVDTTIRIQFTEPVDRDSAISHFVIDPFVDGSVQWEGNTFIYHPHKNLAFASNYRFGITIGVLAQSGKRLEQVYIASFRTQDEVTKLEVPSYLQKYTLSCEAAGLRMALAYRGVMVDEDELLQKIGYDPNGKNGNTWGNPYVGFVGRVNGRQMVNGYGVYWEPISRVANAYRYAKSFENGSIEQLTQSIQKSIPVIVWISIRARLPSIWMTPTGDSIKSVPDEHVVVVTGFNGPPANPSFLIVNDPLVGEMYVSRVEFENKWKSLGNSGVLVY